MASVVLPDWYEDNFVNVENLFIDLFTKVFPNIESGCWTPDDWLEQEFPDPQLQFVRIPGGHVDYQRRQDECFVQVSVITGSRDESWKVYEVIRAVLLPMQGFKVPMADGYTAQIHRVEEIGGPQLMTPEQLADTRLVAATLKVSVGIKTGRNYFAELSAL